ncbi:hypothetical protein C8J57DRAFT_1251855 [Mycena rebaudengoi]|nr:hypothetical protein C8J57DRAFT_1251855 [Mycena rebaudengoi]
MPAALSTCRGSISQKPVSRCKSFRAAELEQVRSYSYHIWLEALQEHRRIVSTEEPPIKEHTNDYQNNSACNRDWHAARWNEIGRFLLDGRHPLTWTEGIERFEKFEFGEMGQGCQTKMLDFVCGGEGYAHGYSMTDAVAKQLMNSIIEENHNADRPPPTELKNLDNEEVQDGQSASLMEALPMGSNDSGGETQDSITATGDIDAGWITGRSHRNTRVELWWCQTPTKVVVRT